MPDFPASSELRSLAKSTEQRQGHDTRQANTIRISPLGDLWLVRHTSGLQIVFGTRESAEQYAQHQAWVTRPSEIVWLNVSGHECRRESFGRPPH
jgi:hypothetical protein